MIAPAIKIGSSLFNKSKTAVGSSSNILKKAILKRTTVKREKIARSKLLNKKKLEREKRDEKERLLESVPDRPKKGTLSGVAARAENFLAGVLEFFGILLVGWLANNLPTIITMVQNLIKRIQTLFNSLKSFIVNLTKWMGGFGKVASAYLQNFTSFDFTDKSNRVENAMKDLENSFKAMQNDIDRGFKSLTTPFGEGAGEETPAPFGTDYGGTTEAVQDPNVRAFLDVLALHESGGRYNVSVGGATFSDMSKHPEMYRADLDSDAAGRYQFISTTYKPIAARLGIKDFSAQSQDLVAVQYLKDLGVLDEIQSGDPAKIQSAVDRLKGSKWTGLKKYRSGQAVKYFEQRKSAYQSGSIQTSGSANISVGERAGYSKSRGRVHAGRDIAAAHGTGLTVPSASVITDKGIDGGYGHFIVFKDASGMEHLYGHMAEASRFSIGDSVSPGTVIGRVGSTGRSTGPHLHWEISKKMGEVGRPRRNVIDPIETGYGAQSPFTGRVSAAQLSAIQRNISNVPNIAGQKRGPQVVVIDEEQPAPVIPSGPSSDGGAIFLAGDSLNSFIKKQLLLELAYT